MAKKKQDANKEMSNGKTWKLFFGVTFVITIGVEVFLNYKEQFIPIFAKIKPYLLGALHFGLLWLLVMFISMIVLAIFFGESVSDDPFDDM